MKACPRIRVSVSIRIGAGLVRHPSFRGRDDDTNGDRPQQPISSPRHVQVCVRRPRLRCVVGLAYVAHDAAVRHDQDLQIGLADVEHQCGRIAFCGSIIVCEEIYVLLMFDARRRFENAE